jgi:chromosome segregation ATPase
MASLTLSFFEISFLFVCAIVVGVAIHFFITSRRSLNKEMEATQNPGKGLGEMKNKYLNEIETKNRELEELKNKLYESEENTKIYQIEIEEIKKQSKKLSSEFQNAKTITTVPESRNDFYEQLRLTQNNLLEHNEKISKLLEQVDVIKESEEKSLEVQRNNKELKTEVNDLRYQLEEKETEISQIKQKSNLTKEMTSMLDNAYSDFNILQSKIQKLESQLSSTKMANIEYEDMKESYYKLVKDLDESKNKVNHYMQENQNLQIELTRTEEKLAESTLLKQQLQKKVFFLEELTNDLQQMSEANRNLESQLKKIGELESTLNIVSEERDILKERQSGS